MTTTEVKATDCQMMPQVLSLVRQPLPAVLLLLRNCGGYYAIAAMGEGRRLPSADK